MCIWRCSFSPEHPPAPASSCEHKSPPTSRKAAPNRPDELTWHRKLIQKHTQQQQKGFFPLVSSCFEGVLLSLTYKFRMKTSERRSCLRASREWSASADTPTTGTSAATWSYNVLHPHYPKYRHHPRQRRAQAAIITIAAASSDDQASGMRASSLSLRFFLFNLTVFASFVFIKLTSNPQRHHTHQLLVL